jgi:S1-C subfamily serine protease
VGLPRRTLLAVCAYLAFASLGVQARGASEAGREPIQQRIHEAAARAVPYIAQVEVTQSFRQYPKEEGRGEYRKSGLGSGILIQRSGEAVFLLTNNHVLDEADEITVRLFDGESYPGKVQGRDARRDLAVVRFQTARRLKIARLGDSNQVRVGDWVMAVGSPLGLESSVTLGIVSAVGRRGGPGGNISDFIQTDAVINPGNSGGALVNLSGEVVGVNTWIASQSGQYEGFGFAIPANTVKRSIRYLLANRDAVYGWLGVGCADLPEDVRLSRGLLAKGGALVLNLYLGSPADKKGLEPGDFLEQIDGRALLSTADLIQSIADSEPGQTVTLVVLRNGRRIDIGVPLDERPAEAKLAAMNDRFWPGWVAVDAVREDPEDQGKGGAELVQVFNSSPADRSDFRIGDIIVVVNEKPVDGSLALFAALDRSRNPSRVTLLRGRDRLEKDLAGIAEGSGP